MSIIDRHGIGVHNMYKPGAGSCGRVCLTHIRLLAHPVLSADILTLLTEYILTKCGEM